MDITTTLLAGAMTIATPLDDGGLMECETVDKESTCIILPPPEIPEPICKGKTGEEINIHKFTLKDGHQVTVYSSVIYCLGD